MFEANVTVEITIATGYDIFIILYFITRTYSKVTCFAIAFWVGYRQCLRASQRSVRSISVTDERIRLAAEKAAMIFEASLLIEQDSLAQERLRLEQQERLLKLKTEIAKTEAKEKICEDFEVIDDEFSSRIRPSSGRSDVKVEPSFPISTPHVSRDE